MDGTDVPPCIEKSRPTDKARDKRLKRAYGISAAEWELLWAEQGRCCAICCKEQTPGKRPFHTDHDHKFQYLTVHREARVDEFTGGKVWFASIKPLGITSTRTKLNDAIRSCRVQAKRKSVRGIICWQCNAGIRKFSDNAVALGAAAEYLNRHREKIWLTSSSQD